MTNTSRLHPAIAAILVASLFGTGIASAQTQPRANPVPAPNLQPAIPVVGLAANTFAPTIEVSNTITVSGQTIKLVATAKRQLAPMNGASLQFRIDNASVGQGVTDASGRTEVPLKLPDSIAPGHHTIYVKLPGDGKTPETIATGKLTVMKSISTLSIGTHWTQSGYPFPGAYWNVGGYLRGASDDVRIVNRKVTLKENGIIVATVNTESDGSFGFKHGDKNSPQKFSVEFDGDANYLGTTKQDTPLAPSGPNIHIGGISIPKAP